MEEHKNNNLKVMVGATAVMVGIVLALLLLLLAQLYCSLFFRWSRRHRTPAAANTPQHPPHPSDLRPFYAQGVLRAPRSFLFPATPDDGEHHHYYSGEASPNSSTTTTTAEQLMMMYNISNPIYDEEEGGFKRIRMVEVEDTATDGGSSGGTPPLSPMEKLPVECPCVPIAHTDSNAAIFSSSSSPSSSTSPSW